MKHLQEIVSKNRNLAKQFIYFQNEFNTYSSKLTPLQKNLIFFAMSSLTMEERYKLTPEQLAKRPFNIKVIDFLTACNIDPTKQKNIYKQIETDILDLQKKPITFTDKYKAIHNISWFSKTSYYNKESIKLKNEDLKNDKNYKIEDENSYFQLFFTYDIAACLVELTQFTKYNFLISHNLEFKYSSRVYEILQQRKDTNLIYISIPEFLDRLSLPKSYKVKSQLTYHVLEKVKKDLNEKLKLGFDYFLKDNMLILTAEKNDDDLKKELFNFDTELVEEIDKELKEFEEKNKKKKKNSDTDVDTSSNSTTSTTSNFLDGVSLDKKEQEKGQAVTFKEESEDSEE